MRGRKGFTLIELLVVIAIIGILATIVLINLNTARNRAKNAAIKGALSELRAAAEMDYDTASTYVNVCVGGDISTTGDFGRIRQNIIDNGGATADRSCSATAAAWCAQQLNMPATGGWCVDSTGYSGSTSLGCATAQDCL